MAATEACPVCGRAQIGTTSTCPHCGFDVASGLADSPSSTPRVPSERTPLDRDIAFKIRSLAEIRDSGLLSEEEFEARKRGLLDGSLRSKEPDAATIERQRIAMEKSLARLKEQSERDRAVVLPTAGRVPPFAPISLSGEGDAVRAIGRPSGKLAIAKLKYSGAGNFIVYSLAGDGARLGVLVNTIGDYTGTVYLDATRPGDPAALSITARGRWSIEIQPLALAPVWSTSQPLQGAGDSVVFVSPTPEGLTTLRLAYGGSANFAVLAHAPAGLQLLVNTIGAYNGEVLLPSGTVLLVVKAAGAWRAASLKPAGFVSPRPTGPDASAQSLNGNTAPDTRRRADPSPAAGTPAPAPTRTAPPSNAPGLTLDELLARLNSLVGLDSVKAEVVEICQLHRMGRLRAGRGLPRTPVTRHLVFVGNPGTGKTTIARLIGQIYERLGVLSRGSLVEATRSDLVGGYVGQTAIKTDAVVRGAVGGVLFIDEAYSLTRSNSDNDYGREAVDTLVKLMEDNREDLAVIVAGYPEEMAEFIESNPGMTSRFPRTIRFDDYTDEQLLRIFLGFVRDGGYDAEPGVSDLVLHGLRRAARGSGFGNARLARDIFEHLVGRQAVRLSGGEPSDTDLITLRAVDFAWEPPALRVRRRLGFQQRDK